VETIRLGIVGLGRLGYQHAENIAYRTPGVELGAYCSILPAELERAAMDFPAARAYSNYKDMLADQSLGAIFIASPSGLHCQHIEAALTTGFHVFSEKPLGVTVPECEYIEKVVAAYPEQVFMLGFMRRYDDSYAYAKKQIDSGRIGTPFMVRSTSLDPEAAVAGAIRFAPTSGGIYLDMAVHDIDLANWYLGGEPHSVYAAGGAFVHSEFATFDDCDNATMMLQYRNGGIAMLYVGRTAAHGYHIETEVIGSKGSLRIGAVPRKNMVEILDSSGVVVECQEGFLERFEYAYLNELHEFVNCIRERRKPGVKVEDGTLATRIAFAATESYRENKIVRF
jgi:myo-inositol 2-dehydrogenase / D-chiro-inositol 1-dehydrogenase